MDSFGGLTGDWIDYDKSKIVILPVPYGNTASYGKGTELGPQAILEASKELELYDIELDSEPFENIIHTAPYLEIKEDPEQNVNEIFSTTSKYINDNKFVIMLGGEHSITTGLVRALKNKHDFCVLQIDAHSDLREEFDSSRYNHACVMRRISDMNIPIIQVGIRSMAKEEKDDLNQNKINTKIIPMHKIVKNEYWMDKVVESLSNNVFITIDLDCLDPGIMPSTGTPEPGGFSWWQLINFLRYVFKAKNVIGCDVVELAPIKDLDAPNFLAAKLVYKLIGYKFEEK
jgi:agmatinase